VIRKEPMKRGLLLVATLFFLRCDISAVDYAVGDVKILRRQQTTVDGQPAIELLLENIGQQDALNVVVTIKAKMGQRDVDITIVKLDKIEVREAVLRTGVFKRIASHEAYDLLTFAVAFSR